MKHMKKVIAAVLVLACVVCAAAVLSSCVKEKYDAFIEAGGVQRIAYDGEVHYPAARLNHDETVLTYTGGDVGYGGCKEPGEYEITISAAETENYKAVTETVTVIIEDNKLNGDVFEQMVERMTASGDFDLNKNIAVDMALDLSFRHQDQAQREEDWNYSLHIKGNIDFANASKTALSVGLYDNRAKKYLMSMSYDGANKALYLITETGNYKIENADLMNALISASGADGSGGIDKSKLSEHLKQAASTVLASGEVSADGDVFTFNFHMDNLFTSTVAAVAEAFMPGVGEQLGRLLYGMMKEQIWSGTSANLPGISGTLDIKFDGNKFTGIQLHDLDYADQSEEGVFFGSVKSAKLGNSVSVSNEGIVPADTSGYSPSKLLNVDASGSLDIIQNGKETGKLGWSLTANMDLAQFIISGGDFSDPALSDNMFHIALWYEPSAQTSSAWANSGDRKTALSSAVNIMDIVYDPAHTGTSMVYLAFAPKTLMNDRMIDMVNGMSSGDSILGMTGYDMISSALDDYSMIQVDINAVVRSMAFRQGETSEAFDALGGAVGLLSRLLSAVNISEGAGVAAIADIADALDKDFGEDPMLLGVSLGEVLQAIFAVNGENAQFLRLTLNKVSLFGSGTSEYNALTEGLVNNFNGAKKTYYDHNNDSISDTPVMTPHVQGNTVGDKFFINLYNQSLVNGAEGKVYDSSDPDYSSFSVNEAQAIDEFAIGYTYTDIYGNLNKNIYTARIIRMEGFDPTKTGAQYVTIYTEPIEGYNILTNFDNMLRAFSDNKITFEGYCISGWIDINAQLTGAQAKSVSAASSAAVDEYSGGEAQEFAVGSELLTSSQLFPSKQYQVQLTYADGTQKTIFIDAEADEFTFSDLSKVAYSQNRPTGYVQGTRKTWRAAAPGDTDMILKTPLGNFTWKIKVV